MSTNRSVTSSQRQADYSNVGYAGRKTGVVLKQTTARDEYGMPLLDDLFSSPERSLSPVKNVFQVSGVSKSLETNQTQLVSDTKRDTTQSSSPRKAPPPRARSPIKTSIGSPRKSVNGSPAKTMGLLASPLRRGNRTQTGDDVAQLNNDGAFIFNKHKRRSLEQAPKRPPVLSSGSKPALQIPRKSMFEVPSSPATRSPATGLADGRSTHGQNLHAIRSSSSQAAQPEVLIERELFVPSPITDPELPVLQYNNLRHQKPSAKPKGKRRWSDIEAEEGSKVAKKKSKPIDRLQDVQEEIDPEIGGFDDDGMGFGVDEEVNDGEFDKPLVAVDSPSVSGFDQRSRQPQSRPQEDADIAEAGPPESLNPKFASLDLPQAESRALQALQDIVPPAKPATGRGKRQDGNVLKQFVKDKGKAKAKAQSKPSAKVLDAPPLPASAAIPRPKKRGLQILKDKDQEEPDVARYSRAGKLTSRPAEYWGFERVVYTEPKGEKGKTTLAQKYRAIKQKSVLRGPFAKQKPEVRQVSVDSDVEDVEQLWEIEPGIYSADLPTWNYLQQRPDIETLDHVDIAVAPLGLEKLMETRPEGGFNLAKTLTLPFYHAGMMDIPPGRGKDPKQSGRFHLTFWVNRGRVAVNVSGHELSIGKDSMWQVPRGCAYSISNPYDRPARLYFSQGTYMTEEEGQAAERAQAIQLAEG